MPARKLFDQYDVANGNKSIIIKATQLNDAIPNAVNFTDKLISIQVIGSFLSAGTGEIKLQDSNDGESFNDIIGSSIIMDAGNTTNMIRLSVFTGAYLKFVFTANTVATGTITVTLNSK